MLPTIPHQPTDYITHITVCHSDVGYIKGVVRQYLCLETGDIYYDHDQLFIKTDGDTDTPLKLKDLL